MFDLLHFEDDAVFPTEETNQFDDPSAGKPKDDFSTPPLMPNTLFYLSITLPHNDTFTLIGPVKKFAHLLPHILQVVSDSPQAIDKLEALQTIEDVWGETESNIDFEEKGFKVFVVEGQRGTYTVLKVLREENEAVYEELPAPVFTVTAHGPLRYGVDTATSQCRGFALTSRFVASFIERRKAGEAAMEAMKELTNGHVGVRITETWEKSGKGNGMVMAMAPEYMWEVRVAYDDQVLQRAKEGLERDGTTVSWRF